MLNARLPSMLRIAMAIQTLAMKAPSSDQVNQAGFDTHPRREGKTQKQGC